MPKLPFANVRFDKLTSTAKVSGLLRNLCPTESRANQMITVHNNHRFQRPHTSVKCLNSHRKLKPKPTFSFFFKKGVLLRGIISTTPLPPLDLRTSTLLPQNCAVSSSATTTAMLTLTNKYSISDSDLQSRGFLLRRSISDLNLDHLNSVFVAVGFPRRDPEKIKLALENTNSLLWVEHKKTQKPVAFARATGDGVFNAIIWDVVVDPSFQGIGLGKAVMERLVEELLEKGIVNIALYSEPRVLGFYRALGFVADPDGIRGMVYSRKQKNKKRS